MSFKWPWLLWGLLAVPATTAVYLMLHRSRRGDVARFTSPAMLPNVVSNLPRWRRHVPMALYLIAMAALLMGMARPEAPFEVGRERATVMLIIDTSKSMEAVDVAPNRLEAARSAAEILLGELPRNFQVGVVGFAGRAQILNRPTTDRVAVRTALASVETKLGTAIGDGIVQALKAGVTPGRQVPMVMVLLSDGNNTTGDVAPGVAADRARKLGVRIYTIALGSQGASSTSPTGRVVKPPNFDALEHIADSSRGRFFSAPTRERLNDVYRSLGSRISVVREQREVTVAFVGAGLLFLAIGSGLSSLWFNRFP